MKAVLVITLAALALALPAQAGNPSLCLKDGWTTAQSDTGASFASRAECASAREVFQPRLSSSASAVQAVETFTLEGSGFHPDSDVTISFARVGETPYFWLNGSTQADGSFTLRLHFTGCATGTAEVEMVLTDNPGVHAFARVTLC